jgi:outer membrane lipoprotein SlyB
MTMTPRTRCDARAGDDIAGWRTYLAPAQQTGVADLVRNVTGGVAAALVAVLSGCGPSYSPNTYSAAAVQQANPVQPGVVVGMRVVQVSADTGVGTVAGAAAGGITGAQVDSGGPITALSALGGSVLGGIVGSGVEHATGDTAAFEYIVRENKGDLVSVTQRDTVPLRIGEHVLVIEGKQARVVRDYTVVVTGAPPVAKPADKAAPGARPASAASAAVPGAPAAAATSAGPPPVAAPAVTPGASSPALAVLPAVAQPSPAVSPAAPIALAPPGNPAGGAGPAPVPSNVAPPVQSNVAPPGGGSSADVKSAPPTLAPGSPKPLVTATPPATGSAPASPEANPAASPAPSPALLPAPLPAPAASDPTKP